MVVFLWAMATPESPLTSETSSDKRQRTLDEIANYVSEFHGRLPRENAGQIGAIYARYSSRHQDSIVDQVRSLLEEAVQKKIFVPAEFIFFDMSVRGYKNDREGLNGLRHCLKSRSVKVVLFFATNRLFRKSYRSLQFVEEQVVERGIRAIFVKSGVDTADSKRWRAMMNVHAMMDEFVVSMNIDNIRASHEGLIEKSLVFGTITYGYSGQDIPGQLTRKGRARRKLVIEESAAVTVRDIFHWFVRDRLPIQQIIRQLNQDSQRPKPPFAQRFGWSRQVVKRVLANSRYRGLWRYGTQETVWMSSRDYARQVDREQPLKSVQLDALRIVEVELWYQAQALLQHEVHKMSGRKPRDGNRQSRPRILDGLLYCPTHNRKLYVGGSHGHQLFCRDCQGLDASERPLYSLLSWSLALRLTCEAIAKLIRDEQELVNGIIDVFQEFVRSAQTIDPGLITSIESKIRKLDQRIEFLMFNLGESEEDLKQTHAVLKKLRQDRSQFQIELQALVAVAQNPIVIPTREEVQAVLQNLENLLVEAAAGSEAQAGRVRQIVQLVTGGRIELFQQGERRAQRGWLQGCFLSRLRSTIAEIVCGKPVTAAEPSDTVIIDFRVIKQDLPEKLRAEVVRRYEAGELVKQIAQDLSLNRNRVVKVMKRWCLEQGREYEDGRTRRQNLTTQQLIPPTYQRVADQVKILADEGRLLGDIANQLDLDRNTITAAWRFWHETRGLVVPDGRTRRKSLQVKQSASQNADHEG
jgi:site-specific DNA recombinase